MNIHELYPSKYVKAHDLGGLDVTVTIRELRIEEVGAQDNREARPVLYFAKATKGLILNKTNAVTIAALYGPETDDWPGKAVTLYPTRVRAFGAVHPTIRIRDRRPPVPEPAGAQPDPDIDDAEDVADPEDAADAIDTPSNGAPPPDGQIPEWDRRFRRCHALGGELWGEDWDDVRHNNIHKLTKGRTHSLNDLDLAELNRLIVGMEAVERNRHNEQRPQKQAA